MALPVIALLFLALLAAGYALYGRFVAAQYELDDARPTPATVVNDGVDFVPTGRFYLLGQHFSAIAAAGPIAGPILACQAFGWLPCLVWIGLGVVFIGAVHDFSALVASVRHGGMTVAEIVKQNLGRRAWLAILAFIWIALVYVIVAFTDITANTFVGGSEDLPDGVTFNASGAVAAASAMYLALSVLMGLVDRYLKPPLWLQTVVFVPATLASVWLGTKISTLLVLTAASPVKVWGALILAYCFVASLLPVWILLQPRGYLGGFVLYMALFVGVVGIFFGGFPIEQPAFRGFVAPGAGVTGALFPFLFVTIACGACSGFHGLVCSGTTSKQVSRESHCISVGYGAMLLEGFVALIALATIMVVTPEKMATMGGPAKIYGAGLGDFLTVLIGREHRTFAVTFGAMAFSTFIFDTLDVSTRLGRLILQELTGSASRASALVATALTCGVPYALIAVSGDKAFMKFWTLFGTSNQLLAGLTLLALTVWLRRSGRRSFYTAIPMVFVMTITLWALLLQAKAALTSAGADATTTMNGVVALCLMGLALLLIVEALRASRAPGPSARAAR